MRVLISQTYKNENETANHDLPCLLLHGILPGADNQQ